MNYSQLIANTEFIDFVDQMKNLASKWKPNYSFVGFNYSSEKIISTKFYFVFFGDYTFKNDFPIPELESVYIDLIKDQSNFHVHTPFEFGSGITFTIKFDMDGNSKKGFFFRVVKENERFVNNILRLYPQFDFSKDDFEDGYGQYVILNRNKVEWSEYLYLKNVKKLSSFDELSSIHFSKSRGVEISAAGSNKLSDQKFIAMGGEEIRQLNFRDKMPKELKYLINSWKVNWYVSAFNVITSEYTIYAFSNTILQDDDYSPVDQFIEIINPVNKF